MRWSLLSATDLGQITNLTNKNKHLQETGKRNNEVFKNKMNRLETQNATLTQSLEELKAQLAQLTSDRDVQMQSGSSPDALKALTDQVEALTNEKAALEKSLADAQAANIISAAVDTSDLQTQLVSYRRCRKLKAFSFS